MRLVLNKKSITLATIKNVEIEEYDEEESNDADKENKQNVFDEKNLKKT